MELKLSTNMNIKTAIVFVFIFFITSPLFAKNKSNNIYIPITTFTTKDGMVSNNIQDMVQDSDGFMWLATEDGLSRFDSQKFMNYTKDKSNVNSIPDIYIEELEIMPNNEIWLSVYNFGVVKFFPETGNFISTKNAELPLFDVPSNKLFGMDKDSNGDLWMSIYSEGIYQWKQTENKFTKHLKTNANPWLTSNETFEIMIDSKDRLWVGTIDSMVYQYDIKTENSIEINFAEGSDDPRSNPIYGFAEGNDGQIYAGGFSGVYLFNDNTDSFEPLITEQEIVAIYGERATVRRVMMDSQNNLWVGTSKSLLLYKNNQLHEVTFYEDGQVLVSNNYIMTILEANDKSIWIGTEGEGMIKISADWNQFNAYFPLKEEPEIIRRSHLYKDNIWIVYPSSKIDLLEQKKGELVLIKTLSPELADGDPRIGSAFQETDGVLWVTSYIGINKIDTNTSESVAVKNEKEEQLGSVEHIHKMPNNLYYFNLFIENAMGYFNEDEMVARLILDKNNEAYQFGGVTQISTGFDDKLWIASEKGFFTLNTKNHTVEQIYKNPSEVAISSFYLGDENNVWAIIDGGLKKLSWNGSQLISLENDFNNILPMVNFDEIDHLNKDIMLISSEDGGMVQLNIKTLEHKVYNTDQGLPSNKVVEILNTDNGPVIVTTMGVVQFNPEFTKPKTVAPRLVIDKLSINNETIDKKNKTLNLEHDYGALNLDLSLLSYQNPKNQEFEYRLIDDSEWAKNGSADRFSFLNLAPGNYNFIARGRTKFGEWSNLVSFPFKVKHPYWQSNFAYALYSLLGLLFLLSLMYLYRRKLMYELELDKRIAQKQLADSQSKAKSDFLAKVSHEVRTPLNGVLGMGELLNDTKLDEEQKIYSETILTSGNHLLEIINDILDLSKIEAGKLELESNPFDITKMLDEILLSYTSQTRDKNILFYCNIDPNLVIQRSGDVIRIKQILFNLLNNAFKFTNNGSVALHVQEMPKNYLEFRIRDTGIGINTETIESLFEPFVQEDSSITRKFGGTGLGLAIVKQLVEKMDGQISVNSSPNQGSEFIFKIKVKQLQAEPEKTTPLLPIHLDINEQQLAKSIHSMLSLLKIPTTSEASDKTINITDSKNFDKPGKTFFVNLNSTDKPHNPTDGLKLPITFKTIKQLSNPNYKPDTNNKKNEGYKNSKQLQVLLVEDNLINQQVSIEILEKLGHTIDTVDNIDEAHSQLQRNTYNLLLLDYHLPNKNGLELLNQWKNPHNIPIIMVTADLTLKVQSECEKQGIKFILGKPFTAANMRDSIENAIRR